MKTPLFAVPTAVIALAALGCNGQVEENEEAAEIAAQLELENGGYSMDDEAPLFGVADELLAATDDEISIEDPLFRSAEVEALRQEPDAVVFHTTVLWGQFPGDRDNRTPRNWSGTVRVNRGAILVRRTVAFEGPTDNLLPRPSPRVVAFTSATLPHRDGLRLEVIDPEPFGNEPLVLTYEHEGEPIFQAPMPALTDGPQGIEVDDARNRIVAVAIPRPVDVCSHGVLGGRWHRVAEGRGRFMGPVGNADGELTGHIRGIYGHRRDGDRVFFGKYINREGAFMGIFAGHYGGGHFEGRWVHQDGDLGALGGEYRESIPGPETGGHFLGRWAEGTCNLRVGPAGPVPR